MESVNQFILYTGEDGDVKLKLFLEDETLWLPQKLIGDLFQVESHTINYHIKEIYKSGELDELSTTRKFRVVQREGNRDVARDVVNKHQPIQSDFDKQIKKYLGKSNHENI